MNLVKVKKSFFVRCQKENTQDEIMENELGRPCVLLVKLKYKQKDRMFVVPLRSNISKTAPDWQYFSLPPNSKTKPGNKHGVHYIKLFPISKQYIDRYRISKDDTYLQNINSILTDKDNVKKIVQACQDYLDDCEQGNKHPMTPNIDGILSWLDK